MPNEDPLDFDETDIHDSATAKAIASVAALISEQDAQFAAEENEDSDKDEATKRAEAVIAAYLRGESVPGQEKTK